ncbi:MAG: hypothetical protein LH471_12105 [Salinibacterium sp.]|nr:hypothetical protein [Salinibacterium sp.]
MSNEGSRFDPRFDPAFQPGYDGPLRALEPELPAAVTQSIATPVANPSPNSFGAADLEADLPVHAGDARVPPRNPFLIALASLAVALLVGGVVVILQVRTMFDGPPEDLDYVTVQLLLVSGPIAIALSIAIGASFLIILGLRPRH